MKVNCPSCMASLIYDVTSGKMECKFCGCFFDLKDVADQEAKEREKETARAQAHIETMECSIYACTSCGAELSVNNVEAATFCAYCGQPTIVFSRVSQELKPKWIIPFKVSKEEAIAKIRARFGKGLFIPRDVKNFEVERVTGIYVPYWLLDTYYYDQQVIKGRVKMGKRSYTKYFRREADCEFTKLTLDASSNLNDESSQRLEPFDMRELKPFEVAYMSGYYGDCFDRSSKDLEGVAKQRCQDLFDIQMLATVKARDLKIEIRDPKFEVRNATYALFPAWFMTFRYQDKPYTMLINGQTGKLVGAVPFDKKKGVAVLISTFFASAFVSVPACVGLSLNFGESENIVRVIVLLFFGAIVLAKEAYRNFCRIKTNEKLTSATQMSQFAHGRQKQQGGTYEC